MPARIAIDASAANPERRYQPISLQVYDGSGNAIRYPGHVEFAIAEGQPGEVLYVTEFDLSSVDFELARFPDRGYPSWCYKWEIPCAEIAGSQAGVVGREPFRAELTFVTSGGMELHASASTSLPSCH